jgi:rare lipoprotein A
MEHLVAAHRILPFNTWLRVTNLSNGRTVNVRIIDRGPFVDGRIIDLSKAAARQIEMLGSGTARVRIEVISAPFDVPGNDFYGVQIGAFANYGNAERIRAKLQDRFGYAQLSLKQGRVPLYRVLAGRVASQEQAQQMATQLASEFQKVFVVRLDATPSPAEDLKVIRNPDDAPLHSDKSGSAPPR